MNIEEMLNVLRATADANPEHRHGDLCKQAADALTELQAEVEWLKESSKIIDDKAKEVSAENKALRNELCYKCANYRESHLGKCDWCKWKKG